MTTTAERAAYDPQPITTTAPALGPAMIEARDVTIMAEWI